MNIDEKIREVTNGNVVLGNDLLRAEIARTLGRQVTKGKGSRATKIVDKLWSSPDKLTL